MIELVSLQVVDDDLVAAIGGADALRGGIGSDDSAEDLTQGLGGREGVDDGAVVVAGDVEAVAEAIDASDTDVLFQL